MTAKDLQSTTDQLNYPPFKRLKIDEITCRAQNGLQNSGPADESSAYFTDISTDDTEDYNQAVYEALCHDKDYIALKEKESKRIALANQQVKSERKKKN